MYKYAISCVSNFPSHNKIKKGDHQHDQEDEYLHTILYAAGTALTMACLKRILVMFFTEEWRVRVFLLLNLLLLAIHFTSNRSASNENQESVKNAEARTQENKKLIRNSSTCKFEVQKECCDKISYNKVISDNVEEHEEEHVRVVSNSGEGTTTCKLSKEELNQRAEAFIAMFRQQLVSDARKIGI